MDDFDDSNEHRQVSRKELAREMRREAYQKAKARRDEDPRFQAMKAQARERRRAAYQEQKAKMKERQTQAKAKEAQEKIAEEERRLELEKQELEIFVKGRQVGHLRLLNLEDD